MRRPLAVAVLTVCFVVLAIQLDRPEARCLLFAGFESTTDFGRGDQLDASQPETPSPTVTVLVAACEIPAGQPLGPDNCILTERQTTDLPDGVLTSPSQIEGRFAESRLFPGDVVTTSKLRTAIGVFIPKGMRVRTVAVTLTNAQQGRIRPGDVIDLAVTYETRSPEGGLTERTKTFAQNVEVFATDTRPPHEGDGTETTETLNLTLLVTPTRANLMKLAERLGEICMTRHRKGDES